MKSLIKRILAALITAIIAGFMTTTTVHAGILDCMYHMAWDLKSSAGGQMVSKTMIEVTITPDNIWTVVDVFHLPVGLGHNPISLIEYMGKYYGAEPGTGSTSFKVDMQQFGTKGCNDDDNGPRGFPPYETAFTMGKIPEIPKPSSNYTLPISSRYLSILYTGLGAAAILLLIGIPLVMAKKSR